ncbi:hypothetical protein A8C35_10505 [Ligilactobacillus salivarius]|uniref:hypothetical protein n=1 Tax=Ligilactobacillus salivarius TaxID=1624 RepID=UPI000BAFD71D|nr:hypothetical protein [Ligilactobacillus salivarius]PAY31253.1 hypothetical protein A8C35_10505 [Ligilactobacillus salivarius]
MEIELARKKQYMVGDIVERDGYMMIVRNYPIFENITEYAVVNLATGEVSKGYLSIRELNDNFLHDAPVVNAKLLIE